ncbi:archaellin/type IV pilin N-terminal domain-containing protein [Haloferax profundi]|uniref:Flagellin n=1 Tax=Haloferax profundi TaxID=1544718 RepID=A0A0W1SV74_9EURY|nr:archaellin/type IV pilin N-terminal domain-containing protein [Haloferax profundi]KTG30347.1 hypothetical protein AUR66_08285 [Haloferax profundi]
MNLKLLKEDRGQVGIGTLIVFIAMVLVAAIAAGVLVDTAGFLQDQAQETGQQSSAQVTDRLQITSVYGETKIADTDTAAGGSLYAFYDTNTAADSAGDGTISNNIAAVQKLNFIVMKAPGAGDIQIEEVTINWIGDAGAEQLKLTEGSVTDGGDVQIYEIADSDGDPNILSDSSERSRVEITLNPDADSGNPANGLDVIPAGSDVTVEFTTEAGATVTKTITVPPTIETGGVVSL